MYFFRKKVIIFIVAAMTGAGIFFASVPHVQAVAVLNQTYSVNVASSTIGSTARQVRIEPVSGQAYVLGSSSSVIGLVSADGTLFSTVSFSPTLGTYTTGDFLISNNQLFLTLTGAGSSTLYRYDVSGNTATLVSSASLSSGTSAAALGNGVFYISKGTALVPYDSNLNKTAATTTLGSTPTKISYANGKLFYVSSAGRIAWNDLSSIDTTVVNIGGANIAKGLAVSNDASEIYFASSTALRKISLAGSTAWTLPVSILTMDMNTSTGKITVVNGGGVVSLYDPINAVSSFTATASSSSAVLSWATGVSDSDFNGVTIRRSTTSYPSSATSGTGVTSSDSGTSFVDGSLSDGTYYYSIFNQTSDGYYSQAVTTSVVIDTPPDPVSSFTATATGTTATLNWVNPTNSDFSRTMLRRSTDGFPASTSDGVTVSSSMVGTSYTQTGLADGTHYYSIFAFDTANNTSTAATSSVTIDTTPPAAPALSASASGSTISLSWDTPATAVSFMLRRSTTSFPSSVSSGTAVTSTGATSIAQSGLADGAYYYSIFAADSFGNYSSAGTASTTIDTTAPSAPTSFAASVSGSTVSLSWSNPVDADFASSTIRRSTASYPTSTTDGTAVTNTIGTSYSDSSLADGTYYYSIFAIDARGNASASATTSASISTAVATARSNANTGSIVVLPTALDNASLHFTMAKSHDAVGSAVAHVASRIIMLNLNANPKTVRGYAISLDPSFQGASIVPLGTDDTAVFQLPDQMGTYTLYLKYYSTTGQASDTQTQMVVYGSDASNNIAQPSSQTVTPATPTFQRVLQIGSKGNDVKALQQLLNARGFTVASSGPGSNGHETLVFGSATARAVKKFQEAFAAQILQPIGRSKGTGIFGPASMKVLSSIGQ